MALAKIAGADDKPHSGSSGSHPEVPEPEASAAKVPEGYKVDIACLRRYPRSELLERTSKHSTKCATMGHCIGSGSGLVARDGTLTLLDTKATPFVLDAIRKVKNSDGERKGPQSMQGTLEYTAPAPRRAHWTKRCWS